MSLQSGSDPTFAREVHLVKPSAGSVAVLDFAVHEHPIPELAPGEFLVRNHWLSIDAATALRLGESGSSYLPQIQLNCPIEGWAVGTVVRSASEEFPVGQAVLHNHGWRDHTVLCEQSEQWGSASKIDLDDVRTERLFLGPLGPTGLTAWAGLLRVAELKADDVVFVSAGAGAVGSLVIQLAKRRGHRVIASAGSQQKVQFLTEVLHADAAFCYRDGSPTDLLHAVAPDGIDVYFDNVGGAHLEAALAALRVGGRVALCGAIAGYQPGGASPGPKNLFDATVKGLTLRGFLARMYAADLAACRSEFTHMLQSGELVLQEQVYEGLENAPTALVDLLAGVNLGKVLVHLP